MEGIVAYVGRDLAAPDGGVYSAEDADSEGVEGRFYVWTPARWRRPSTAGWTRGTLGRAGHRCAGRLVRGDRPGATSRGAPSCAVRSVAPLTGDEAVEAGRRLLFEARDHRVRPGLDDKVLTEWNAMYGSALAEAAAGHRQPRLGRRRRGHRRVPRATTSSADDGRWLRSWQADGGARHLAYAGDYAWLVDCFTRLGELTGRGAAGPSGPSTPPTACSTCSRDEGGGFFTTGHDAEALIVRTKEVFDGATPSANAVAALALARLGALTGADALHRRRPAGWSTCSASSSSGTRPPSPTPC